MSDRSIGVLSAVASILGLSLAIFTQYKFISIISLLVFETAALLIWVYYVKQRNKNSFPYEYEVDLIMHRYVFNSFNSMTFEVVMVLKVTCPILSSLPLKSWWYGKGSIVIESVFSGNLIHYDFDAKSSQISYQYPLTQTYRFGDTIVVQYQMILEDTSNQEIPELSRRVDKPTRLYISEVVLKYKEDNPPGILSYAPLYDGNPIRMSYQTMKTIPFDKSTKSYRATIANPMLGYIYRIVWER